MRTVINRRLTTRRANYFVIIGMMFIAAVALALPAVHSDSVGSSSSIAEKSGAREVNSLGRSLSWGSLLPLPTTQLGNPPLATYDGTACTNLEDSFTIGDTVCAKANSNFTGTRTIYWVDDQGGVIQTDTITPTSPSANYISTQAGNFRAYLSDGDGLLARTAFTVSDPQNPKVNLTVAKYNKSGEVTTGNPVSYGIFVTNNGPDAASTVQLTDVVPPNVTYVTSSQDSGPTFNRTQETPTTTWQIASLAPGASASFTITYTVNGGAGTTLINTAEVTTTTEETHSNDNTSTSRDPVGSGGGSPDCSLDCPNDIVTTATTSGENGGANVTFSAPEGFGDCGAITSNPASGTFFPIGTTTVESTSATGGGFCSFTVTVIDSAAPTISCPPNPDPVAANQGQGQAYVPDPSQSSSNVGTPTTTGTNIVVTGSRDDGEALTASYPIGTTTITWTVTEYSTDPETDPEAQPTGRSANCEQTITVTGGATLTVTCPADKTVASPNGCDPATVNPGTATSNSGSATILGRRSDNLAYSNQAEFNDPFPAGVTEIVWTATGADNQSASCTQTITITTNDTTPPTLTVPPNVSATTSSCTATLDDELGVATAEDDCGTVSISRSGVPTFSCPTPQNPNRQCESFIFPTGTTIITYTATNSAGLSTTGTQTVTVTENPPVNPTITAPNDLTVNTGPEATICGAFIGDATLGSATASDNCPGVTVTRTGVPAGNIFPVGNTTVTYRATDKSGNFVEDTQVVTVQDTTPPAIDCPDNIVAPTDAGSCTATVNPGTATATDHCDSSPTIVGTRSDSQPLNAAYPKGTTTITWRATDDAGNYSECSQTVTVNDEEPPAISCPANITVSLALNSPATSIVVNYTPPVGSDNCAGSTTTQTAGLPSGASFSVGTTINTFRVTDASGNDTECSFTVTVLYNFTGFFNPVSNPPAFNNVNAGRSIPIKFSLSGNKGLGIFAPGYPMSQQITCNTSAPLTELEGTETPGGSTLTYSPDTYHYNWKTESSWAGTCRILIVKLNDGSEHTALFKFK